MSIRRPVNLRPNPARPGTYLSGRLTQDFDGSFYMERPGYLRTDIVPHRGARTKISRHYAYRKDLHLAHDYGCPEGTPVFAVEDGVILKQGTDSTGGVFIYLRVKRGLRYQAVAFYYHLKPGSFRFKTGARVQRGDILALTGNSGGKSTGGHLHFAMIRAPRLYGVSLIYSRGVRFDPQPFISGMSLSKMA